MKKIKLIILFVFIFSTASGENLSYKILEKNGNVETNKGEKILVIHRNKAFVLLHEKSQLEITDLNMKISGKAEIFITEKYILNAIPLKEGIYLYENNSIVENLEDLNLLIREIFLLPVLDYINIDLASTLEFKKKAGENIPDIPPLQDILSLDIGCGCVEVGGEGVTPIQIPDFNPDIEHKKNK